MTRGRIVMVAAVVLAGLFFVQRHRLGLVRACTEASGLWDGTTSTCKPAPGMPIIQRDLRRTSL